ncbi:hypothetical protein HPB51_024789 [Rhipicephalus microplus]|uniref:Uncharacterized protein n=1 Tax=Rhipicephalus microplus TaxID=6941 RepID=A0A9J6DDP0_RHIMP|nr:hypothetical protein HPB51_024789 [Rhipicephalus microplus]
MAQHVRPEPSARYCTAVVKREHGRQNQTRSSKKPIRGVPRETEGAAAPANYGRQRVHCRAQGRVEAPCRVASACRWSLEACPVMSIGQTCRPEIGPSGYRQHCLRSLALCRPVEVVRRTQAAPNFAGSPAEGSRKSEQRILHAVSVSSITSRCRFEVNNMLTIRGSPDMVNHMHILHDLLHTKLREVLNSVAESEEDVATFVDDIVQLREKYGALKKAAAAVGESL